MHKRPPDISDEEEARIQAMIAADPDDSEWTDAEISAARSFAEVFPEMIRDHTTPRIRPARR